MENIAIASELIATIRHTLQDAIRSLNEPGYFDAILSAQYMGISSRAFESVAKEIPCHRMTPGGKRLYSRADLDAFMATRPETAVGQ